MFSSNRIFSRNVRNLAWIAGIVVVTGSIAGFIFLNQYSGDGESTLPRPANLAALDSELQLAIERSLETCRKNRNRKESLNQLAELYFANDLYESAIETFQLIPQTELPERSVYYQALTLQQLGKASDSERMLNELVNRQTKHAPVFLRLALLTADKGELASAREFANQAVSLNPQDALGHLLLGSLCLQSGEPEACLEQLKRIGGQAHPYKAYEVDLSSRTMQQLGLSAGVVSPLPGSQSFPNWLDPWMDRLSGLAFGSAAARLKALSLVQSGDFTGAIALLSKDANLPVAEVDQKLLLQAYASEGLREQSFQLLEQLVKQKEDDLGLRMTLAENAIMLSNEKNDRWHQRASSITQEAIDDFPTRWEPFAAKAQVLQFWDRQPSRDALALFDQAGKLSTHPLDSCHIERINLLLRLKEWGQAESKLSEISQTVPQAVVFSLRIRAAMGSEDWLRAQQLLEEFKSKHGSSPFWTNEIARQEQILGLAKRTGESQ